MKHLQTIARVLLGLTFVFSGFVKGIDPWGSAYKFTDYFHSFGWEVLSPLALPLGILLALGEFTIGVALIFNFMMRLTSWLALLFMAFFSVLTFYIALANPVSDCGCFGDALKLTNWQTFYKNLFFIALAIYIFINRKQKSACSYKCIAPGLTGAFVLVYLYLVFYSYNHLPIIDFRPYKIGTNIPEAMQIPEGAPMDIYETIFVYKNKQTKENKDFTEDNYPWQDTLNWEFVSMEKPRLVQKGYQPPIHDFMMIAENGDDVKDFFLYDKGYTFIVVSQNLSKTNREAFQKINKLAEFARENKVQFIGLTATGRDEINAFAEQYGTNFEFFNCDEITLKTIVRSNPGLLLMKEGTILNKWHFNDIPEPEEVKKQLKK